MKAWRLEAVKINDRIKDGSKEPRARVQKAQQQQVIDKILNRGVKTNWLVAGLFQRAGITPAV